MAICSACRQEMSDPAVTTCRANDSMRITAHNWIPTVRYESDTGERCDREKCPACQRQRISCRCGGARRR